MRKRTRGLPHKETSAPDVSLVERLQKQLGDSNLRTPQPHVACRRTYVFPRRIAVDEPSARHIMTVPAEGGNSYWKERWALRASACARAFLAQAASSSRMTP